MRKLGIFPYSRAMSICVIFNMKTKRRGRPSLPKMARKSVILCARTDLGSYRSFRRAADAAGMKLTDWVRDRLERAAKRDLASNGM
jgi:hypothetical protein